MKQWLGELLWNLKPENDTNRPPEFPFTRYAFKAHGFAGCGQALTDCQMTGIQPLKSNAETVFTDMRRRPGKSRSITWGNFSIYWR
jgi:hypothetical protein